MSNLCNHDDTARDTRTGERVRAVFDNAMCAHVWAQLSQTFGRSGNGNLYFRGRALFSYGSHYVAGFLFPNPDTGEGIGLAAVNGDSYSVTTARHVAAARRALRAGSYVTAPELTALARAVESATYRAAVMTEGRPTWDSAAYAESLVPSFRRALAVAAEGGRVDADTAAALFRVAGARNPEREARDLLAAGAKAREAAKARADKRKREEAENMARRLADKSPESVLAEVRADARAAAGGRSDYRRKAWEGTGRDYFRAAKAAKARGWKRIADNARACHAAVRAGLALFPVYEAAHARRYLWATARRDFRAALAALPADVTPAPGESLAQAKSAAAYVMRKGETAAQCLAAMLGADVAPRFANAAAPFAVSRARLAGVNVPAALERLADLAAAFRVREEALNRETARAKVREGIRALRAAADLRDAAQLSEADIQGLSLADLSAIVQAERARATAMQRAESFARSYAPGPYRTPSPVPAVFRVAGWTPDSFARVVTEANKARLASFAFAALAERAAKAKEAAEREAAAAVWIESAREAWRAGERQPVAPAGFYRFADKARKCPDGGAMLRAEGVTRDTSGEITGGTLRTSQGAEVPLTHAIRAFRFLKLCRESGKAWRANGRTVRVGHFQIQEVRADGSLIAGCHFIAWGEVERLARALGVADLAAADAREERDGAYV